MLDSAPLNDTKAPEAKVVMYGLVRDKFGKPRIDGDPNDLHPAIKAMLTPEERAELGIEDDQP